jgi:hypothetical protein
MRRDPPSARRDLMRALTFSKRRDPRASYETSRVESGPKTRAGGVEGRLRRRDRRVCVRDRCASRAGGRRGKGKYRRHTCSRRLKPRSSPNPRFSSFSRPAPRQTGAHTFSRLRTKFRRERSRETRCPAPQCPAQGESNGIATSRGATLRSRRRRGEAEEPAAESLARARADPPKTRSRAHSPARRTGFDSRLEASSHRKAKPRGGVNGRAG